MFAARQRVLCYVTDSISSIKPLCNRIGKLPQICGTNRCTFASESGNWDYSRKKEKIKTKFKRTNGYFSAPLTDTGVGTADTPLARHSAALHGLRYGQAESSGCGAIPASPISFAAD
jgi:hypothetical protein